MTRPARTETMPDRQRTIALGLHAAVRRFTPADMRRWARAARESVRLYGAFAQDALQFQRGSALLRGEGDPRAAALQAQVLKTAHRLEKGLALPQPRVGFGRQPAALLRRLLDHCSGQLRQEWSGQAALQTLQRLADHHAGQPQVCPEDRWTRKELQQAAQGDFACLVRSRRSIRQFGDAPLPEGWLERAVELARHSPSVCNRSGARVWLVRDAARRQALLRHQDGNQGFADAASALLVVSVEPAVFHTVGERHQGWIDGGLFAMTLIHALHHQGLATCCLNWCVSPTVDHAFKREAGLPRNEMVVMLLAVGTLPERFTVAHSPRRPVAELIRRLDDPPRRGAQEPSRPCTS